MAIARLGEIKKGSLSNDLGNLFRKEKLNMSYGLVYHGSKSSLAKKIIDLMPSAPVFIDLFGGGGAMTHCAIQSGKFEQVWYNELDPLTFQYFTDAVTGNIDLSWISREEFQERKNTDGWIRSCWSRAGIGSLYIYSEELEPIMKDIIDFIVNGKNIEWFEFTSDKTDIRERKLDLVHALREKVNSLKEENLSRELTDDEKKFIEKISRIIKLHGYRSLEHVQRMFTITGLKVNQLTNKSYDEVDIPEGAVVYCDPPYRDTAKLHYKGGFDYDKYYDFLRNISKTNPVFCSEYWMPDDFTVVSEFKQTNSVKFRKQTAFEKLYTYNKGE